MIAPHQEAPPEIVTDPTVSALQFPYLSPILRQANASMADDNFVSNSGWTSALKYDLENYDPAAEKEKIKPKRSSITTPSRIPKDHNPEVNVRRVKGMLDDIKPIFVPPPLRKP